MGDLVCFRCGKSGHLRSNCPRRTPGTTEHPPAAPEGAPDEGKKTPGPPPVREVLAAITPTEAVGNAHEWANRIRQQMGELPHCGDPADIYDSSFRRAEHLSPIHQCQLRQLAATQLPGRQS